MSPTVVTEALDVYAGFFPGWKSVDGADVADAYLKAIAGNMTGQTLVPCAQSSGPQTD